MTAKVIAPSRVRSALYKKARAPRGALLFNNQQR